MHSHMQTIIMKNTNNNNYNPIEDYRKMVIVLTQRYLKMDSSLESGIP